MDTPKPPSKRILDVVEGLKPVAPEVIKDFATAMTDKVIPEIVKTIEDRRLAAAETRLKQLKVLGV
jgi:hypothetical protein